MLSLCIAIACSKKFTPPEKTPVSLEITAPSINTYSGGTIQFSATAQYSDGSGGDVTESAYWTNRPGRAGVVDANGLFAATLDSTGSEIVYAEFQGRADSVEIRVDIGARSLVIWPESVVIKSGETVRLVAIAEFYNAGSEMVTKEDVSSDAEWSTHPGSGGSMSADGQLNTIPGFTGVETVIASFQAHTATCQVRIVDEVELPIEMVTIPAGSFTMGDDAGSYNERPAHEVFIDAFQMGKYEVTVGQYVKYLNNALNSGDIYYSSGIVSGRTGPFAWLPYCDILPSVQFPERFIEHVETAPNEFGFLNP